MDQRRAQLLLSLWQLAAHVSSVLSASTPRFMVLPVASKLNVAVAGVFVTPSLWAAAGVVGTDV